MPVLSHPRVPPGLVEAATTYTAQASCIRPSWSRSRIVSRRSSWGRRGFQILRGVQALSALLCHPPGAGLVGRGTAMGHQCGCWVLGLPRRPPGRAVRSAPAPCTVAGGATGPPAVAGGCGCSACSLGVLALPGVGLPVARRGWGAAAPRPGSMTGLGMPYLHRPVVLLQRHRQLLYPQPRLRNKGGGEGAQGLGGGLWPREGTRGWPEG